MSNVLSFSLAPSPFPLFGKCVCEDKKKKEKNIKNKTSQNFIWKYINKYIYIDIFCDTFFFGGGGDGGGAISVVFTLSHYLFIFFLLRCMAGADVTFETGRRNERESERERERGKPHPQRCKGENITSNEKE